MQSAEIESGVYVQQVQCTRMYRPHKYAENSVRYSLIVNSPRLIQNLAFNWGDFPGKSSQYAFSCCGVVA